MTEKLSSPSMIERRVMRPTAHGAALARQQSHPCHDPKCRIVKQLGQHEIGRGLVSQYDETVAIVVGDSKAAAEFIDDVLAIPRTSDMDEAAE